MVADIFSIFSYEFMQRAFIVGLLIAMISPILGVFLVLRRLSMMGDTMSHSAFAGVAIGVVLNFAPTWTALAVAVVSALGIMKIRKDAKVAGDAALAVFFSLGLAIGIVLISLKPSSSINLSGILFGSLLLVGLEDIWIISAIVIGTLVTFFLLYKEFFFVTLDEDLASVSGLSPDKFNYFLTVLTGLVVVASIRIVGVLLVSALMVIPALASMQIARSFRQTILLAIMIAVLSVISGLTLSFYVSAAPGGTIILVAATIFLLTISIKRIWH